MKYSHFSGSVRQCAAVITGSVLQVIIEIFFFLDEIILRFRFKMCQLLVWRPCVSWEFQQETLSRWWRVWGETLWRRHVLSRPQLSPGLEVGQGQYWQEVLQQSSRCSCRRSSSWPQWSRTAGSWQGSSLPQSLLSRSSGLRRAFIRHQAVSLIRNIVNDNSEIFF